MGNAYNSYMWRLASYGGDERKYSVLHLIVLRHEIVDRYFSVYKLSFPHSSNK